MAIVGLDSVAFGVDDLALGVRFWEDFGLARVDADADAATFATPEGATIVLRRADDVALPPAPVDGPTVREITWGADTPATLDEVERALRPDGQVTRGADGTVRARDPAGYAFAVRVARVRHVPLEPTRYNGAAASARIDERAPIYDRARPHHLAHVVFRAPNLDEMREFYTRRLGFVLTDSYPGHGLFLRAGGTRDHHSLFLFNPDGSKGFHHVAFEVRNIHEVFAGGLYLTARGWQTHIGPGRHPVSSAYFWYFRNPCGGAAEYDFDTDACGERWVAREFEPTPETFAEWALPDGIARYSGIQTPRA